MKIFEDKQLCCGCSACANICPRGCIVMQEDCEGFTYPVRNSEKCIECGLCEKVCPILSRDTKVNMLDTEQFTKQGYAAINLDEKNRLDSSSGGVFTEIAKFVINTGGVVCGAVLDSDCKGVHHRIIKNINELYLLRGSKYVQSDMGNTYRDIKSILIQGITVLFSGVPCQISGLKSYLGRNFNNLWCVDVICHGVPSPALWRYYVTTMEKSHRMQIENVNFRQKRVNRNEYGRYLSSTSKKRVYVSKGYDSFWQFFLKDICLRPSCYKCKFKGFTHDADITLGDFWGVKEYVADFNDGKGASIVLLHTKKGEDIFNSIKKQLKYVAVDYVDVFSKHNDAMLTSVSMPKARLSFFTDMQNMSFKSLCDKYIPLTKKQQVKFYMEKHGLYDLYLTIRGKKQINDDYGMFILFK